MSDNPPLLVVDDEEVIGEACRRIFSPEGFAVDVSTDPGDGLKRAREKDYRAILLDVVMPKMDGLQFLEALRETNPHVPVLIMTGYPGVASAAAGIRLGVVDYITKPFTVEEVTRAVQRVLRLPPATTATGAEIQTSEVFETSEVFRLGSKAFAEPAPGGETLFWDESWLRLASDGSACVGAVLAGVREAAVKAIRFPRIGEAVYQGLPFAGVSLADNRPGAEYWAYEGAASAGVSIEGQPAIAIPSPVSGTVVGVNEVLAGEPSLLVNEPCGRGWIACICPTPFEEEASQWRPRGVILLSAPEAVAGRQRRRLAALGCQVLEVTRREELVAAVRDRDCQVLLLDGRALGDHGPDWVAQINTMAPSMKVIVVAGSDPVAETAYRKQRIFYYAVEPLADNEMANVLEAALRSPQRHLPKTERPKGDAEPIGGIATTNRNGHKVQLFSSPGLLRRNEGLGSQIVQRLLERSLPVVVTAHEANLHPAGVAKAAEAYDRLIVLSAQDSGLLPGGLARDARPEFAALPAKAAGRIVRLGVQPDALGGLEGLDPRTTSALAEHIVREMRQ